MNERTRLLFQVCQKVGNPFLLAAVVGKRAGQLLQARGSSLSADAISKALREVDEKGMEYLIGSQRVESTAKKG